MKFRKSRQVTNVDSRRVLAAEHGFQIGNNAFGRYEGFPTQVYRREGLELREVRVRKGVRDKLYIVEKRIRALFHLSGGGLQALFGTESLPGHLNTRSAPLCYGLDEGLQRIMRNRFTFALAVAGLAASIAISAQTVTTRDTFEVASVRPADPQRLPGGGLQTIVPCSGGFELTPGRITISGTTVYRLITLAYGIYCPAASNLGLISGGSDWVQKEAFDIQATLPPGTPLYTFQQLQNDDAPKLQAMLRNLLADRFRLALHRTPKDMPIYNVYFVKEGRVKLSADQTKPSQAPNPMASPLQVANDPAAGIVRVRASAIPIRVLINGGQGREGRFVIDKTGLVGLYDIEPSTIDVGPLQPGVSTWPQIMGYLGFKLEAARGPVETIVIDRLERPSEN